MVAFSIIIFNSGQNNRIRFQYLEEILYAQVRDPSVAGLCLSDFTTFPMSLAGCLYTTQSFIFRFFKITILT